MTKHINSDFCRITINLMLENIVFDKKRYVSIEHEVLLHRQSRDYEISIC